MTTPNPQHKGEARTPETEALLRDFGVLVQRMKDNAEHEKTAIYSAGRPDLSLHWAKEIELILARAAELSAQESKPVALPYNLDDLGNVLVSCAGLLDNIKSEWSPEGCWSEWDQNVRDGITRQLQKLAAPSVSAQDASPKDGWRPIETAPKDGRWILQSHIESGGRPWIGRYAKGTFSWWDERGTIRDPTHWQPLPEPPHD